MVQGTKNVDSLLVDAMNSEIDAETFYRNASAKAQSQAGKQLFQELADFEHNHFEHVRHIIEARKKRTKITVSRIARKLPDIKPEVKGEFEPNKEEIVDILNLGMKAEKEAQERYQAIAARLDDQKAKEIFSNLAEDERRHHALLEAEHYHISNKGTIIWGE